MKLKPAKIGNLVIDPPWGIPAGVVTTTPETCRLVANTMNVGAVWTKSVPVPKRDGNIEPIITQPTLDSLLNAVGYSSFGVEEAQIEYGKIYPLRKPLIMSIVGANAEEFRYLATKLKGCSDAFEVVLSCPHTKGYGILAELDDVTKTFEITEAVTNVTDLPVIVKLAPDITKIAELAKAAEKGGASAISAINTVRGEYIDPTTRYPVLTNKFGGISGRKIKKIGLECVSLVRKAVDIPIIGMGGIETAEDVMEYFHARVDAVCIGTGVRGMNTPTSREYFNRLEEDIRNFDGSRTNYAGELVKTGWLMKHKPYTIERIEEYGSDIKVFYFDKTIKADPGQFVFTWLPGKAEKPFSIADDNPLTIAVRKVGGFTSSFSELEVGGQVMIRGPYGNKFPVKNNSISVGGGIGISPLRYLAKKLDNPTIFLGAKTKDELLFEEELSERGNLIISTDDGSKGYHGFITNALEKYLREGNSPNSYFYNCGPEIMMKNAFDIEMCYTDLDRIFASVERHTSCGIGMCGKCSIDSYDGGRRACVDGTVFDGEFLWSSRAFGKYKRDESGTRVEIR